MNREGERGREKYVIFYVFVCLRTDLEVVPFALVLSLVMPKSAVFPQMGLFHKCLQNIEVLKLLPIAENTGEVISLKVLSYRCFIDKVVT